MDNPRGREIRFPKTLTQACAALAAGFGFLALLGWILAVPLLCSFGSGLIPMAPSTALLFVLLGVTIFLRAHIPQSAAVRNIGMAAGVLGILAGLLLFTFSYQGIYSDIERLGIARAGKLDGMPIGHMSPVTALLFFLAGGSFLASLSAAAGRPGRAIPALGLAFLVIAASCLFAIAYFIGPPLLYGGRFIPPALPTSLAFAALGIALAATARMQAGPCRKLNEKANARAAYALTSVFVVMALGIVAAGHLYYRSYEKQYRLQVERELAAIAELKASELVQWRKERLGDASFFYRNTFLSTLARRFFDQPDNNGAQKRLRAWLEQIRTAFSYDRVCLHDAENLERLSAPPALERPAASFSRGASEAFKSGTVAFEDFYRSDIDGRVYLNLIVPLFDEAGSRIIGVLSLRIDPENYLYPLITRWPTFSRTAETLIVRREGNEAVFLNALRFRRDAALKLRIPLERRDVPAVQAASGRQGIVEGIDYRGVPVLAYVRNVSDSPWFLVARMDVSEVYEPLREKLWEVVLFIAVLLLGAGSIIGLIWRNQRVRFYRKHYEAAEALLESKERQRTIVETSPLAVIVTDPEGNVKLWNNAAEATFGWSANEVVGKPNPIVPPDRYDEVRQVRRQIMDGKSFVGVETERLRKDGSRIAVSYSATALCDAAGRKTDILAIVADITERKRAEAALQAKNEELNAVTQQLWQTAKLATMGELASSIAHELNNPLATVSLRIESLTEQTSQDDLRRRELEIIGQEVERMGNLVANLLQFSRRGRKQISTVDIREEIEKTIELIHYHFRKNNIRVVREFAAEVPGILADRQQLRQLFLNLFTNAGDAMPKGGTLTIRIKRSEVRDQGAGANLTPDPRPPTSDPKGKAFVVIEIADTGIGIPPEILPKVMEPFYSTKPEGKGTGLGLAICRRIAQEHGGTLDITSEGIPGKGTKVRITLSSMNAGNAAGLEEFKQLPTEAS